MHERVSVREGALLAVDEDLGSPDERGSRKLRLSELDLNLHFAPHDAWVRAIERAERGTEVRAS
jgi:hypothetical protein